MSGHSKWAQIKHKKATTDAKRGNLFAKLARAISIAAKEGGTDSSMNAKLRLAVDRARSFNMPGDNVERAILRATSSKDAMELSSVLYEGYGPGGSALLIEGVTDNKNRTSAEIKHILSENGGKFAESGSVAWLFSRRGIIFLPTENNPGLDTEEKQLLLIDAGADDFEQEPEGLAVYTDTEKRLLIGEKLILHGFHIGDSSDAYIPNNPTHPEAGDKQKLEKLLELLESQDDILNVWSNAENL